MERVTNSGHQSMQKVSAKLHSGKGGEELGKISQVIQFLLVNNFEEYPRQMVVKIHKETSYFYHVIPNYHTLIFHSMSQNTLIHSHKSLAQINWICDTF